MASDSALIIVGICHIHQEVRKKPWPDGRPECFQSFLEMLVRKSNPDLIAEEYNKEFIDGGAILDTVPRKVAGTSIPHLFCEMSLSEREKLGVGDRVSYRLSCLEKGFEPSENQMAIFERSFFPIREKYWLNRLAQNTFAKCLMIIGSAHIDTFPERARRSGYKVEIYTHNWSLED